MRKICKFLSIALMLVFVLSNSTLVFAATTLNIGHARRSSLSNAEQVSITPNSYFTDWTIVLRPTSEQIAEKMVSFCKAGCANNKIRYSQAKRKTLYNKAKSVNYDLSKIKEVCYTDCSSFMAVCAIAAGVNVDAGVDTSSMKSNFEKTGKFKAVKVSNSSYLKKGDILLKPKTSQKSGHTAMVLQDGSNAKKISSTNNSSSASSSSSSTNVKWPAIKNIHTYCVSTKNNTNVYKTAKSNDGSYGKIYATDLITILSYDSSSDRFYVSYPVKGGTKKGYIAKTAVTAGSVTKAPSKWTATNKITTYRRSGGGEKLGYISKDDVCYTISTSGNWKQIIYPVSGGYKMGWIKK